MSDPSRLESSEILRALATDAARGLTDAEAARRLARDGPNQLVEHGGRRPMAILLAQFAQTMVVVLLVAAGVSAWFGDWKDLVAIATIVILNALLGFTQDYRAERAIAALKRLAVPRVRVRRDGVVCERDATALVMGDVVLLEAGGAVPADCRLLEAANLRTQEAALTGESVPVEKDVAPLAREHPLAERRNMAFMGTAVTYGRGTAVVTATGMRTELGRIATLLQTVKSAPTPLQRKLARFGRGLVAAAVGIVLLIFVQGLLRGTPLQLMFITAVSMAVAAVPEGLPAVVTIALALGAQRMLRRRALIRHLPAVESLGAVTVICSDKTGTLTENRMTVVALDAGGQSSDLDTSFSPIPLHDPATTLLLAGGALCNDAAVHRDGSGALSTVGDPTEGALLVAAARGGLAKDELDARLPRVREVPFDSDRKRMTTLHDVRAAAAVPALAPTLAVLAGTPFASFTKGAVDTVLAVSTHAIADGRVVPITPALRASIEACNAARARRGLRILAVAVRTATAPDADPDALERDLVFVGLASMIDPARPEAHAAVGVCGAAGIRPVMITGDHPLTAGAIATELGIDGAERLLTGADLDRVPPAALAQTVERTAVYARVSPEHKLRIVEALQARGEIVAMTGDGVNDAPALKKADIGVAMGVTGTDVAKEAADMVLLDDNFATIVAAVEEGRVIYDNIRKFIKYLLTSNAGELWVMLLAPLLGMPLPLLPIQILWINLVTDGLPALALGVEPAERDVMRRPPYDPREKFFGRGLGRHIVVVGLVMGLVPLGAGFGWWRTGAAHWNTMLFTILTLAQMGHALAVRSHRDSFFSIGPLSNRWLLGAVALTFILQLLVVYIPVFQPFFSTSPLSPAELGAALVLSSVVFWVVELEKAMLRRAEHARA